MLLNISRLCQDRDRIAMEQREAGAGVSEMLRAFGITELHKVSAEVFFKKQSFKCSLQVSISNLRSEVCAFWKGYASCRLGVYLELKSIISIRIRLLELSTG